MLTIQETRRLIAVIDNLDKEERDLVVKALDCGALVRSVTTSPPSGWRGVSDALVSATEYAEKTAEAFEKADNYHRRDDLGLERVLHGHMICFSELTSLYQKLVEGFDVMLGRAGYSVGGLTTVDGVHEGKPAEEYDRVFTCCVGCGYPLDVNDECTECANEAEGLVF